MIWYVHEFPILKPDQFQGWWDELVTLVASSTAFFLLSMKDLVFYFTKKIGAMGWELS